MSDIDYIKSLLKKFEEKRYEKEGTSFLDLALEEIIILLEETNSEREIIFCRNTIQTYRTLIIEMATSQEINEMSDFIKLNHMIELLTLFKRYELPEDSIFSRTLAKTMVLYIEAARRELSMNRLTEDERKEIYNTVINRSNSVSHRP